MDCLKNFLLLLIIELLYIFKSYSQYSYLLLNIILCKKLTSEMIRINKNKIYYIIYQIYIVIQYIKLKQTFQYYQKHKMGAMASGALNASGFSSSIAQNRLPYFQHITHNGIFNENFFDVGNKAKKLLEIYHGLGISNCDLYDLPKRNYFLSLFLKSNTDGQKRTRPINVVVCLDVSGSMNSRLKSDLSWSVQQKHQNTRLNLARQAIVMLYQKLNDDDVFSLVTFHNDAKTIIESSYKKSLDQAEVRKIIYQKFETGGTTIKKGFQESVKNIQQFRTQHTLSPNYQHRIVMLTDVGDNSVANQKILIEEISSQNNINTTIIGVSSEFRSQTCQKLVQVKGFNYFCAVQNSDLQTYLSDRFDYNFFPCVQKAQISIQSDQIDSIQVFGSVDSKKRYQKIGNKLIVTKMQTGFPSQLQINKQGRVQTQGGLILVKLKLNKQQILPHLNLKIKVNYQDMMGHSFSQEYLIDKKMQVQQFYSDDAIQKGIRLFYYTQTMRNLLQDMESKEEKKKLNDQNKFLYKEKLDKLKQFCPMEKHQELERVVKIVVEHQNPQVAGY